MNKINITISILLFLCTLSFAQKIQHKIKYIDETKAAKGKQGITAEGDKVTIKDGTTVLIEIENEGSAGSIFLPDAGEIESNTTFKLYNTDGLLFWGNNELGFAGGGVSRIDNLSDAIHRGNSLFLGLGSGISEQNVGEDNKNTSVGINSMFSNTGGYRNAALGNDALYSNTMGTDNSAFGYMALYSNVDGALNTAIGGNALRNNSTGGGNIANGYLALYDNTTGSNNTALGIYSLRYNTEGYQNIAVGHQALYNNTIGYYNSAIGDQALFNNTIGVFNTAIGFEALYSNVASNNGVAVGFQSQQFVNDIATSFRNSNTSIGYQSLRGSTTASNNIGTYNSVVGYQSLFSNSSGKFNSAIGSYTIHNNTTGYSNSVVGYQALYYNESGYENSVNGREALYHNNSGYKNIANGYRALYSNIDGYSNTANGYQALYSNIDGKFNSANGSEALYYNSGGYYNTANGFRPLYYNSTGNYNTAIGYFALFYNATGDNNTAIGHRSGPSNGNSNLFNTTALGYEATTKANNQIRIGNSDVVSIGGYAPWSNLSDSRYKLNVQPIVAGLDFIMGLRPITYNLDIKKLSENLNEGYKINNDGHRDKMQPSSEILASQKRKGHARRNGFIAQEVEELVNTLGLDFGGVESPQNENDMYRLRYSEFVVPLVKAVQEQQELIKKLEERIQSLEGRK